MKEKKFNEKFDHDQIIKKKEMFIGKGKYNTPIDESIRQKINNINILNTGVEIVK